MKKLFIASLITLTATAWAQTAVKVDDAWVRGTVATQKATGAFMRLTPSANARLVAAQSPVAGVVLLEGPPGGNQEPTKQHFLIGGAGPSPLTVTDPTPVVSPKRRPLYWRINNNNR